MIEEKTKTVSIFELHPRTAQIVLEVIKKKGRKSEVIINPTLAQTQLSRTPQHDYPSLAQQTLKPTAESCSPAEVFFEERQSLLHQAKGEIALAQLFVKQRNEPAVVFHNKEKNQITFRAKRTYDQIDPQVKQHHRILKVIHPR